MTTFSKWKTLGYAAAIFVTGGISGGALGVYETKSRLFAPQRQQEMAVRIIQRLKTRLALSSDQEEKIRPIVSTAASSFWTIRLDAQRRINAVFDDSYAQVETILTPDQRVKFDEMLRERRALMQSRWPDGHLAPRRRRAGRADWARLWPRPRG